MSILHNAVDVLTGAAWHCATLTHADIDNETAVVPLLEEVSGLDLLGERLGGHGGHPDRAIDELLGEQVDTLEVVNIDLASKVGLVELLVELDLVELAQEVVLDP